MSLSAAAAARQTTADAGRTSTLACKNALILRHQLEIIAANGHQKSQEAVAAAKISPVQPDPCAPSESAPSAPSSPGRMRHALALLALSGLLLANMNRQAYNQALVRMIRRRASLDVSLTTSTLPPDDINELSLLEPGAFVANSTGEQEPYSAGSGMEREGDEAELDDATAQQSEDSFDWTGTQIGLLQAAFSYGYMPFMIPGGRLSEIYGAKWVFFLSGFGSALCSLLTPLFADYSFGLLLVARVSMGICQTGISPALYALLTRWLPPEESSIYLAMIKVAIMIGFMFGSLISGFLTWRSMFAVVGSMGLVWSLVWTLFASSLPEDHKFLSKQELEFIKRRLREHRQEAQKTSSEQEVKRNEQELQANKLADEKEQLASEQALKSKSAPWPSILTNPVVIAFTLTKFTVKLSTDAQTIQVPYYLRSVFHVSDEINGMLNGANFAIQALFTGLVAYLAKVLIERRALGMDKTAVRKLFQGINNFGMAFAYTLITLNQGSIYVVCCAVIALSITSMFGAGGEAVLPVDLTTEYSASIMAIANSAANLSGIVMPKIVSFILDEQPESATRWNIVWLLAAATLAIGGLLFTCLVEARIQDFESSSDRKREGQQIGAKQAPLEATYIEMDSAVSLVAVRRLSHG